MATIKPEFDRRGVKILGLSTDPAEGQVTSGPRTSPTSRARVNYPIIADTDHAIVKAYGMLPADVSGDPTERTPAQNATLRNVFVIGPDKKIKLCA